VTQADDDRIVAERIAAELADQPGRRRGWREVRVLMGEFEIERLSYEARRRMASALSGAGLVPDPPLESVDRRDTVVLSRIDGLDALDSGGDRTAAQPGSLKDVLKARTADPGQRVRTVDPESLSVPIGGGVRWFDVGDSSRADAAELLDALNPGCGGQLTREMVDDLLSPDPRPKVKLWDSGSIRGVAAFRVMAAESDEGAGAESLSKAGVLIFEPVEFLVGGDWLITCWHDAEVYRGADRVGERATAPSPTLFTEVERRWRASPVSSAGDLAVLVLFELALTYAPAYRQLYVWEEEWELDFFRRHDRCDHETLRDTRAGAAILRDWLHPLNPVGMRHDVERAWFPGVTGTKESGGYQIALDVDDRIDGALASLRDFNQTLRSAYDLLQLREDVLDRHRDERFQRNIAVGGSAILIPTLVAGIMGANTWVPGQSGPTSPHWAFAALIVLVVLSGVIAWALLRWLRAREDQN
jgi:Mg2+ and Co2+ transporter CorA